MKNIEIVEIVKENIEQSGCFCLRSQKKSKGYQNKAEWILENTEKGLNYLKIMENQQPAGFIEFIPIENSSRVVLGQNYFVIHCLWISITGKGYATKLIQACISEAKRQGKNGVLVVTNQKTSWTPGKEIFLKNGFEEVEQAPYGFELLINKFTNTEIPYFPSNWEERLQRFNDLTIIRTKQCPYIEIATENICQGAKNLNIKPTILEPKDRSELLEISPTPYGVYGVVYKNTLVAFNRLTVYSAMKRLKELMGVEPDL